MTEFDTLRRLHSHALQYVVKDTNPISCPKSPHRDPIAPSQPWDGKRRVVVWNASVHNRSAIRYYIKKFAGVELQGVQPLPPEQGVGIVMQFSSQRDEETAVSCITADNEGNGGVFINKVWCDIQIEQGETGPITPRGTPRSEATKLIPSVLNVLGASPQDSKAVLNSIKNHTGIEAVGTRPVISFPTTSSAPSSPVQHTGLVPQQQHHIHRERELESGYGGLGVLFLSQADEEECVHKLLQRHISTLWISDNLCLVHIDNNIQPPARPSTPKSGSTTTTTPNNYPLMPIPPASPLLAWTTPSNNLTTTHPETASAAFPAAVPSRFFVETINDWLNQVVEMTEEELMAFRTKFSQLCNSSQRTPPQNQDQSTSENNTQQAQSQTLPRSTNPNNNNNNTTHPHVHVQEPPNTVSSNAFLPTLGRKSPNSDTTTSASQLETNSITDEIATKHTPTPTPSSKKEGKSGSQCFEDEIGSECLSDNMPSAANRMLGSFSFHGVQLCCKSSKEIASRNHLNSFSNLPCKDVSLTLSKNFDAVGTASSDDFDAWFPTLLSTETWSELLPFCFDGSVESAAALIVKAKEILTHSPVRNSNYHNDVDIVLPLYLYSLESPFYKLVHETILANSDPPTAQRNPSKSLVSPSLVSLIQKALGALTAPIHSSVGTAVYSVSSQSEQSCTNLRLHSILQCRSFLNTNASLTRVLQSMIDDTVINHSGSLHPPSCQIFIISSLSGKKVCGVSPFSEEEVIFGLNTTFRVTKILTCDTQRTQNSESEFDRVLEEHIGGGAHAVTEILDRCTVANIYFLKEINLKTGEGIVESLTTEEKWQYPLLCNTLTQYYNKPLKEIDQYLSLTPLIHLTVTSRKQTANGDLPTRNISESMHGNSAGCNMDKHIHLLNLLVAAGVDGAALDQHGNTAVMAAVSQPNTIAIETVKFLVTQCNVDVNHIGGENQQSALQLAVSAGNLPVIETLIGLGARVPTKNNWWWLTKVCHPAIVQLLARNIADEPRHKSILLGGLGKYKDATEGISAEKHWYDSIILGWVHTKMGRHQQAKYYFQKGIDGIQNDSKSTQKDGDSSTGSAPNTPKMYNGEKEGVCNDHQCVAAAHYSIYCRTLLSLAAIYVELAEWSKAIAAVTVVKNMVMEREEKGEKLGVSMLDVHMCKGELNVRRGRHQAALGCYLSALHTLTANKGCSLYTSPALGSYDTSEVKDLIAIWVGLARVFTKQAQYEDALLCLSKAKETIETLSAPIAFHSQMIDICHEFSHLGIQWGKTDDALQWAKLAVRLGAETWGADSALPDMAVSSRLMGEVFCSANRFDEALLWFNTSMAQLISSVGEDSSFVVALHITLANHPTVPEPAKHAEKALAISRHIFVGDNNPLIASVYACPGLTQDLLKALQILTALHNGDAHPHLAYVWSCIGTQQQHKKNWGQAETAYTKALNVLTAAYGETHPEVANLLHCVALVLEAQNKTEEALSCHLKVLQTRQHVYGEVAHARIAATYRDVGNCYRQLGKIKEAVKSFERAKSTVQQLVGDKHQDYGELCCLLGNCFFPLHKPDKAIDNINTGLQLLLHSSSTEGSSTKEGGGQSQQEQQQQGAGTSMGGQDNNGSDARSGTPDSTTGAMGSATSDRNAENNKENIHSNATSWSTDGNPPTSTSTTTNTTTSMGGASTVGGSSGDAKKQPNAHKVHVAILTLISQHIQRNDNESAVQCAEALAKLLEGGLLDKHKPLKYTTLAVLYEKLGTCHYKSDDTTASITAFQKALTSRYKSVDLVECSISDITANIDMIDNPTKGCIATTMVRLAESLCACKQYQLALRNCECGMAIFKKLTKCTTGKHEESATSFSIDYGQYYGNYVYGCIKFQMGDFESALAAYEQCVYISRSSDIDVTGSCVDQNNTDTNNDSSLNASSVSVDQQHKKPMEEVYSAIENCRLALDEAAKTQQQIQQIAANTSTTTMPLPGKPKHSSKPGRRTSLSSTSPTFTSPPAQPPPTPPLSGVHGNSKKYVSSVSEDREKDMPTPPPPHQSILSPPSQHLPNHIPSRRASVSSVSSTCSMDGIMPTNSTPPRQKLTSSPSSTPTTPPPSPPIRRTPSPSLAPDTTSPAPPPQLYTAQVPIGAITTTATPITSTATTGTHNTSTHHTQANTNNHTNNLNTTNLNNILVKKNVNITNTRGRTTPPVPSHASLQSAGVVTSQSQPLTTDSQRITTLPIDRTLAATRCSLVSLKPLTTTSSVDSMDSVTSSVMSYDNERRSLPPKPRMRCGSTTPPINRSPRSTDSGPPLSLSLPQSPAAACGNNTFMLPPLQLQPAGSSEMQSLGSSSSFKGGYMQQQQQLQAQGEVITTRLESGNDIGLYQSKLMQYPTTTTSNVATGVVTLKQVEQLTTTTTSSSTSTSSSSSSTSSSSSSAGHHPLSISIHNNSTQSNNIITALFPTPPSGASSSSSTSSSVTSDFSDIQLPPTCLAHRFESKEVQSSGSNVGTGGGLCTTGGSNSGTPKRNVTICLEPTYYSDTEKYSGSGSECSETTTATASSSSSTAAQYNYLNARKNTYPVYAASNTGSARRYSTKADSTTHKASASPSCPQYL